MKRNRPCAPAGVPANSQSSDQSFEYLKAPNPASVHIQRVTNETTFVGAGYTHVKTLFSRWQYILIGGSRILVKIKHHHSRWATTNYDWQWSANTASSLASISQTCNQPWPTINQPLLATYFAINGHYFTISSPWSIMIIEPLLTIIDNYQSSLTINHHYYWA